MTRLLANIHIALITSHLILVGCATLPDYEILEVPRPAEVYKAGLPWQKGIGTIDSKSKLSTKIAPGAGSLSLNKRRDTELQIASRFTEWAAGALSLSSNQSVEISLQNLKHEIVTNLVDVDESFDLLFETIIADSFSMKLNDGDSLSIDEAEIGVKLGESIGQGAELTATQTSSNTYHVTSDRPLVVAIRIVKPTFKESPDSGFVSIDLSNLKVGRPQQVALGYLLTLQQPADPISREVAMRIDNLTSRAFPGTVHLFEGNNPWISPNRTTTEDTKLARNASFIWDKLSLFPGFELSDSQVYIVRQYVKLDRAKSGLRGTR